MNTRQPLSADTSQPATRGPRLDNWSTRFLIHIPIGRYTSYGDPVPLAGASSPVTADIHMKSW